MSVGKWNGIGKRIDSEVGRTAAVGPSQAVSGAQSSPEPENVTTFFPVQVPVLLTVTLLRLRELAAVTLFPDFRLNEPACQINQNTIKGGGP
jgi:hypothetical protein